MNPNNQTLVPSSRNSQAGFRLLPLTAGRVGKLAACLITLGIAALAPSARAQLVVLDDQFNDPNNNIGLNTNGIGHGFTTFSASGGIAIETNGTVRLDSPVNGAARESYSSIDSVGITSLGTLYEYIGLAFTNDVNYNVAPNTDRLFLGVQNSPGATDWLENSVSGMPNGFWIQINSDDYAIGANPVVNNAWADHTSALFYKSASAGSTELATWQFDNLGWTSDLAAFPQGTNFSPVLHVALQLNGTAWSLNITGDTMNGGSAISFTNTYAASGINVDIANGLNNAYIGGEDQTEGPAIIMSVHEIKVTQLGNLIVYTPAISTPEYGYNTNTVFAGEAMNLSCAVTTVPRAGLLRSNGNFKIRPCPPVSPTFQARPPQMSR